VEIPRLSAVAKWLVERRLKQASERLKRLREDLRVIDEQLEQLADEADDMGIRSLVSETPGASYDYHRSQAHADAMAKHRAHVVASIAELEQRQDSLLDRMVG
jgi:chromosome segregation ATPase